MAETILSLSATLGNEAPRNSDLTNEIREVDYANSAIARQELNPLVAHHKNDPRTFDYPEAALQKASLAITQQLAEMRAEMSAEIVRAEMRRDLGHIQEDIGHLHQELRDGFRTLDARIVLTHAQQMNMAIREDNSERTRVALPLMPVHKVVAGSGLEKAPALCGGTDVLASSLLDSSAAIGDVPAYTERFWT